MPEVVWVIVMCVLVVGLGVALLVAAIPEPRRPHQFTFLDYTPGPPAKIRFRWINREGEARDGEAIERNGMWYDPLDNMGEYECDSLLSSNTLDRWAREAETREWARRQQVS